MMRLSTMWKVDRTVDAEGRSAVADEVLARWEHDAGSARFFRSSANFLYVFHRDGVRHFLRFADSTERDRAAIEAETDFVCWLQTTGIDLAVPVPTRVGTLVETVATDVGVFHGVAFAALEGSQPEIADVDHAGFAEWGAALGRLHAAAAAYPHRYSALRPSWRHQLDLARSHAGEPPAVRHEIDQLEEALAALPQTADTFGLVHGDFELDNLVWRRGNPAILDFDDASHLWYVADIAFALTDLGDAATAVDAPPVASFLRGYAKHRTLDDDLGAKLQLFRRLRYLVHHARVVRAADLTVGPDHPDWLRDLSSKLQHRIDAYRSHLSP